MLFIAVVQWETAHDGLTCEQFAAWKKDNDPKLQAQGLAAYLNEEGIGWNLDDVVVLAVSICCLYRVSCL